MAAALAKKQRFPSVHSCAAYLPLLEPLNDLMGSRGFLMILFHILAIGPASLNTQETPSSFILLHLILCCNAKQNLPHHYYLTPLPATVLVRLASGLASK